MIFQRLTKKLLGFFIVLITISWGVAFSDQLSTYRNIIPYPYHAAPYYSYPYTTGYGYEYNTPIVNSEYDNTTNDRQIVTYPDGPYEYDNYYKVGTTYCFQKADVVVCEDY
jgi:hypothetical protein